MAYLRRQQYRPRCHLGGPETVYLQEESEEFLRPRWSAVHTIALSAWNVSDGKQRRHEFEKAEKPAHAKRQYGRPGKHFPMISSIIEFDGIFYA